MNDNRATEAQRLGVNSQPLSFKDTIYNHSKLQIMAKFKILEEPLYFLAGEFVVYRAAGGGLCLYGWLKENTDIDSIFKTEVKRKEFVSVLMKYWRTFLDDIEWPHK